MPKKTCTCGCGEKAETKEPAAPCACGCGDHREEEPADAK